jgi:hypothetical protein
MQSGELKQQRFFFYFFYPVARTTNTPSDLRVMNYKQLVYGIENINQDLAFIFSVAFFDSANVVIIRTLMYP